VGVDGGLDTRADTSTIASAGLAGLRVVGRTVVDRMVIEELEAPTSSEAGLVPPLDEAQVRALFSDHFRPVWGMHGASAGAGAGAGGSAGAVNSGDESGLDGEEGQGWPPATVLAARGQKRKRPRESALESGGEDHSDGHVTTPNSDTSRLAHSSGRLTDGRCASDALNGHGSSTNGSIRGSGHPVYELDDDERAELSSASGSGSGAGAGTQGGEGQGDGDGDGDGDGEGEGEGAHGKSPRSRNATWSEKDDRKLRALVVGSNGKVKWSEIAKFIPGRNGKQCRERWRNQLDTSINTEPWTEEEDRVLLEAHHKMGNSWCKISKLLDGKRASCMSVDI